MNRNKLAASVLALVFGLPVMATAQERHLKKSDLPPAVQRTVDEQSRGATIRGYSSETEEGQLEYEVEMTVGGRARDVTIAPDGSVIEIEEQVVLDSLPGAVRQALGSRAGKGTITSVESITKHGTLVAYEAHVRLGGKRSEIQVGPNGQPLSHEE